MNQALESPGPQLRRERERRGLSAQKAADDLHLDLWVIEGLESDQYERVGPPVYVKGHIKKYADLLGLPVEDIVKSYQALASGTLSPGIAAQAVRVRPAIEQPPWLKWGVVALVLVLAGGFFGWRAWHPRAVSVAVTSPGVVASTTDSAISAPDAMVPRVPGEVPTSVQDLSTPSNPATGPIASMGSALSGSPPLLTSNSPSAVVAVPPAAMGRVRMRVSFSADSRITVRDATGRRIFAGKGQANSMKLISGKGPMQVYLEHAGGVQLEINEHAVAIGPQFVKGDVARFRAGADGMLRR